MLLIYTESRSSEAFCFLTPYGAYQIYLRSMGHIFSLKGVNDEDRGSMGLLA